MERAYELDEKLLDFVKKLGVDDELGPYGYILEKLREGENIVCVLERLKEEASLDKQTNFSLEQINSYLIEMVMGACYLAEIENKTYENAKTDDTFRKYWEEAYLRRGIVRPRISVEKAKEVIGFLQSFETR